MITRMAITVSMLLGCGATKSPEASGGGSGDGSDGGDPSGADPSLTHGSVKLEFRRSENQASDPTVGTASVSITMTYRACLGDFYDANPSLRQTGPDGELIFGTLELGGEGWSDRLCDAAETPGLASCDVESIEQRLDPVKQLTVRYAIDGSLENRLLRFGPLPTKETAGCLDPIVRAAVGGVKGYDTSGAVIWEVTSIEPLDAVTDQGGEIVVRIAASSD